MPSWRVSSSASRYRMSSSEASETPSEAHLFIIAAPSGTGKTTLIQRAFAGDWDDAPRPEFSVSHTTRAPRPDEVDGVHYYFVDEEEFRRMIDAGEFLEWAVVHGQLKGTSKAEVDKRLASGVDVLLDIDVQGVESIQALFPGARSIMILPPGFEELRRRITGRGHDSPDDVARRLAVSLWEIERYGLFDCVIINDDIERASRELVALITSKCARSGRDQERVQTILQDFRSALEERLPEMERSESALGDFRWTEFQTRLTAVSATYCWRPNVPSS